jgi:ubiquinone/menaquinone biosynthesis C-methylase UbiE
MAEAAMRFDDSAAYERFMGRWSRAVAPVFLDWLAPSPAACWLEVGCGTGICTGLIVDGCSPASLIGVDSSQAQIEHARGLPIGAHADFRVADALALPFPEATFDVVVSALLINFVQTPALAVSEMRRVARTGGVVAGYVWDFAAERSPSWPMRVGMRRFGMDIPDVPGSRITSLAALSGLFEAAGLSAIHTRSIEVAQSFTDFDDFWRAQTPGYMPTTKMIGALPEGDRQKLQETVKAGIPLSSTGKMEYSARAHAIKGCVSARLVR